MNQVQREITEFLKTEASDAMVRACRGGVRADDAIAEAQELLALRARIAARNTPANDASQLELPFLKKAA